MDPITKELRKYASREKAVVLQGFFKTGPGEYAQGDKFIGVKAPDIRKVSLKYSGLPEREVLGLLYSPVHEERLLALSILIARFSKAGEEERTGIFRLYLKNTRQINNWDLVDLSAPQIVGRYLADKDKKLLYGLAVSKSLWERRIAIVSTLAFIRLNRFAETLKIAAMLLKDKEPLIHKAAGWMLREVGKRSRKTEEGFLDKHALNMPRTMLRYAIERFPEAERRAYLSLR